MQFSPFPCYLIPVRPKGFPQCSILKHLQPVFRLQCESSSFTPIQKNQSIVMRIDIHRLQSKRPSNSIFLEQGTTDFSTNLGASSNLQVSEC
jgi:hypothetical protein